MSVTIYHNPRCSKSRETLALLEQRGIEPVVVEYLKTPPAPGDLERILDLLGMTPREIMRSGEAPYAELGLDDENMSRDALIAALCAHPILLQRPIVLANGKAAIGRPPENVAGIL